jgi:hypothetical protein
MFYLTVSDSSDIPGYKTLTDSPSGGPETSIAVTCSGGSDFLVGVFATEPDVPGVSDYPAGTATRNIYASASSGSGTARLHLSIYIRDVSGTEILIRDEFSPPFSNAIVAPQQWSSTVTDSGAVDETDRIVLKLYAQRVTGPANVTVTVFFEGTINTSRVQTTISAGAQGPEGPPGLGLLGNFTVATLPTAPNVGDHAFVTDCSNATWNVAPIGGGTTGLPVFWDGTSWKIG